MTIIGYLLLFTLCVVTGIGIAALISVIAEANK